MKFSLRMLLFHPSEKPAPGAAVVIALLSDAPVVSVVPDLDWVAPPRRPPTCGVRAARPLPTRRVWRVAPGPGS